MKSRKGSKRGTERLPSGVAKEVKPSGVAEKAERYEVDGDAKPSEFAVDAERLPSGVAKEVKPSGFAEKAERSEFVEDAKPSEFAVDAERLPSGITKEMNPSGVAEKAERSEFVEDAGCLSFAGEAEPSGFAEKAERSGVAEKAERSGVAEKAESGLAAKTGGLPSGFAETAVRMLGLTEAEELFAALDTSAPVSVRFNPYKLGTQPEGRQVPWCRYGYYLDERPQFTLDPLFHAGVYYVQEAASMFVGHIFSEAAGDIERPRILDLCAAPGGKTTLLSTLAGLDGLVVANETIRQRAMTLASNVKKWGLGNVLVTNNDPSHFEGIRDYFDVVTVDAPCSGEGMFRRNPEARGEWSAGNVELCARRQRRILADIWHALKPGGILIYSTCTFNRTENEENVEWLVREYGCEAVGVEVPDEWGVVKDMAAGVEVFRFYPHRTAGEGFFAAVMRKPDGKVRTKTPRPRRTLFSDPPKPSLTELARWVDQPEYVYFSQIGDDAYGYYRPVFPAVRQLAESLTAIYSGVEMGRMFHGKLRPEHSLALFHGLARDKTPAVSLETEQALRYLRKNDPDPALFAEGLNLVTCGGFPLGWLKRIGNRVNNMYPNEMRIINL